MENTFKEKYIADKQFYKKVLKVALPITIQNLLSSSMEIIDSIMVAAIHMTTAVSNAAQFNRVFYYGNYGLSAGITIYASQYYGSKDYDKLKKTFGFNVAVSVFFAIMWIGIFLLLGEKILAFYLNDPEVIANGYTYLSIMVISLPVSALSNAFATLYRCVGRQKFAMTVTFISGFTNLLLNYLLIFGNFGFPQLGLQGAAIGSFASVGISSIVYLVHSLLTKAVFIGSFKEMFSFDMRFVRRITDKSLPLIFNEAIFGFGTGLFSKAFGYLGKNAMDSYYVAYQVNEIFQFAIYGYGASVGIVLGNTLGENKIDQAKKERHYFEFITFVIGCMITISIVLFHKFFLSMFSVTDPSIYDEAILILYVFAFKVLMRIMNYVNFATLRSGGESKVITWLDSGIMYAVGIPIAFISILVFNVQHVATALLFCQLEQAVRLYAGAKLVGSERWAKNLTID